MLLVMSTEHVIPVEIGQGVLQSVLKVVYLGYIFNWLKMYEKVLVVTRIMFNSFPCEFH